jgi:protein O-mannosyl-transferase
MKAQTGRDTCMSEKWAPLLLAGAVLLAYVNSFSGAFLFDDYVGIVRNPRIAGLASVLSGTARPVVDFTFWLNYVADGYKVAGYHLINLAIHAGAALTLYGLVRRTLCVDAIPPEVRRAASGLALATALLWGVHPLLTGSVTYICQRAESLMGLFYLQTLYAATRAAAKPRSAWAVWAVLACGLGMGSKEVMVTAPLLVPIYDRIFLYTSWRDAWRKRWPLYLALFATYGVAWLDTTVKHRADPFNFLVWKGTSPVRYALTQVGVIQHYLRLCVWPHPLCLDYGWPPAESIKQVWSGGIVLAVAGGAVLWCLRRHPAASFPGLWFFAILAPTSSVLPRPDFAFEHRMYLPLAGVVVCVVLVAHRLLRNRARPVFQLALAGAAAVVLAATTHARNTDYRTEVAMWRDVVRQRPDNLRARNDLAVALSEAGRAGEALAEYNRVLALIPADLRRRLENGLAPAGPTLDTNSSAYHCFRAHANMGQLYFREKRDNARAAEQYVLALRIAPAQSQVRELLRQALRAQGVQEAKLEQSIETLLAARQMNSPPQP